MARLFILLLFITPLTDSSIAMASCLTALSPKNPVIELMAGGAEGTLEGKTQEGSYFASTDKGAGIKYQNNQDGIGAFRNQSNETLLMVADGLGGHGGGEIASHAVLSGTKAFFEKGMDIERISNDFGKMLQIRYLKLRAKDAEAPGHMATTLVGVTIKGSDAIVFHVGDSKAMMIDPKGNFETTKDHSYVQELIDRGELTPEQARNDPRRSIMTNAISLSQGKIDPFEVEGTRVTLEKGSVLVLGSDGLWDNLLPEQVLETVRRFRTPKEIAEELRRQVSVAVQSNKDSDDNFSVIVYRH